MRRLPLSLSVGFGLLLCLLAASPAPAQEKQGADVKLDGLASRAPAAWVEEETTSQFRFKQFKLPAPKDAMGNAELVIFFFGGTGGSTAANIKRWKDMFEPAEGKTKEDSAKEETFKVSGVEVTYLDLSGTYLSKFPPAAPNAKIVRKPDHRMLVVIFDSPKGPYFMRLVGPAATVGHYKKGFDEWLKAFK
jgi:hypothetical protein